MRQEQQRQLNALQCVQAFLDEHAAELGALKSSEGRMQLDDAVARLEALGNSQATAVLQTAGLLSQEASLTTELKSRHMQPIATFARARLRGVPDVAALTRPVTGLVQKSLVRAARAMAAAAAPHAEVFARGGLPDAIAQLNAAADALNSAIKERANTRVRRMSATKGIKEEILRGREAAAMLHAVVSSQFAGDTMFMAGWHSARRVAGKPGAVRVPIGSPALVSAAA